MTKRDIFSELIEGFDAAQAEREGAAGRRPLVRSVESPFDMTPDRVRHVREKLQMSRQALADRLHVEPRTMRAWEHGVSRPNAQAAILLALLDRNPRLADEIAALPRAGR